jgi:DNA-binding NtrC family response regulator
MIKSAAIASGVSMRPARVFLFIALGLFAVHVAVAAASTRLGPLPLSSHLLQLAFGLLAAVFLREKHKGLRVVFMSGYIDPQLTEVLELDHNSTFLQKPFTPDSLYALVRETIGQVNV